MKSKSTPFAVGERVERRRKDPNYAGQDVHERGTILSLETSSAGERAVRVMFDSGYTQLNLTSDLRRPTR